MEVEKRAIITPCVTRQEQHNIGENHLGMEIKNDRRFRDTGNLFIEIKEKKAATNYEWVPSGIYRQDNSWIYAVGDKQTLYLFQKAWLIDWAKAEPRREVPSQNGTSKGLLLKVSEAKQYLQPNDIWTMRSVTNEELIAGRRSLLETIKAALEAETSVLFPDDLPPEWSAA